jgi:PAS domain S-box-containing protein
LKDHDIGEISNIKVEIKRNTPVKTYVITFSEKKTENNTNIGKLETTGNVKLIQPALSTNVQFERFFNRIEKVNLELDKRQKLNSELHALNKQLILKDQLLETNKNNIEALLNNNLQAFVLVDTFYSIQAFNDKAKDLFLTISKKEIEKNVFFFEYFGEDQLSSIKKDFKLINSQDNHQFTVTRSYFDTTSQKNRTFRVNYTAVLDKQHDLRSISIGFLDITNLVDVTKKLETSQNLISSVFNSTRMGIIIINKNGDIVDANRGASNNLNISILKLKDLNIQSIFKEVLDKDEFPFFKLSKSDTTIQWKNDDSSVIKTFDLRIELLQNDPNNTLLVVTIRDITNEVLVKERLRNITNNIPGTVFRYLLKEDGSDELLYASKGAKELWGFDGTQLMNNNQLIWGNYHPDDLDEHKESIKISKEDMSEWFHEWRYIHPEKGLRWHRGSGKPKLLSDNSVAWDSIIIDITDEKELESLITRSSKLAKIGSWEVDLINESIYWSPMTREIHEVSEDYVPDFINTFEEFFFGENKKIVHDAFENAINKNEAIDIEIEIVTAKKTNKWIRINAETELIKGNVVKVFGSTQDINTRKKTELELIEKTKFLTLLSEVNKELLDYDNWNESIIKIFKLVGESIDVDRVYFFKYITEDDTKKIKHVYEWCGEKTFSQIDDPKLLNLPTSHVPLVTKAMNQNKPYYTIINDMPDGEEKKLYLDSDIKSIYMIPIRVRQKLFGILGFDDCTNEREWSKQETSFLSTLAQNISIAYEVYVSERKLVKEVKAKESILESIKDGFLSVNKNWIINYWNEEAQRLTGIPKGSALENSFWSVFPEINDLPVKEQLKTAVESGTTTPIESKFPGLKKWFELNIYPVEEGASIYFKDITDRKGKEQELLLSHQRFEKVTEATNDAIWEWDIVNDSLYWGIGYQKQFGHPINNEDNNIKEWEKQVHPDDIENVYKNLNDAVNNPEKTGWTHEYRYQNFDLSYSYVVDRGYIIRDEKGKAIRMIGAMTDISHRKEYEESLEYLNTILKNRAEELTDMNLELERFAYIASHDLQEPLRMITGFLTQLEKKYADQLDEKANKYIYFAVDGAKRMRKIILDLLQYSRIGKLDENEAIQLDLNLVIKEVANVLDSSIEESNTTINVSDLPKVFGFKLSFTQIFQNLISNAIKYRNEDTPPLITIDYEENETQYIFSVCDNGIGIDSEYHDKVFVIFQRLHNKDEFSGTGVGLAIVKKVVEQMGGEIWLKSNKVHGTTFYFSVPKEAQLDSSSE